MLVKQVISKALQSSLVRWTGPELECLLLKQVSLQVLYFVCIMQVAKHSRSHRHVKFVAVQALQLAEELRRLVGDQFSSQPCRPTKTQVGSHRPLQDVAASLGLTPEDPP